MSGAEQIGQPEQRHHGEGAGRDQEWRHAEEAPHDALASGPGKNMKSLFTSVLCGDRFEFLTHHGWT